MCSIGRTPIFGPETWSDRGGASWSHWDLWFCLACTIQAKGEWAELEEEIITRARRGWGGSGTWERKRSHLLGLRARLDAVGLTAADLVAESLDDKPLRAKARRKVLDQELTGRDLTPAMKDTPRRRLRTRAYFGYWDQFPVSPQSDYDLFGSIIENESHSFRLGTELEKAAKEEHVGLAGKPADAAALWRGILTAGLEAFDEGLRDSGGSVCHFLGDALMRYASLRWRETGIDPLVYWRDLCEWCVWEAWGIRHKRDTAPFRGARKADVDFIEAILLDLEAEYRSHRLDSQAAEALQLVGWLAVATRSFDRFVPTAERLGAKWWMPIDAMGAAAVRAGKTELAVEVYSAAIVRGEGQTEYLAQCCEERTGRPATNPRT